MHLNILLLSLLTTFATSQELTGDEFMHEAYLDFSRTFLMKWGFNETHIVFEVSYKFKLSISRSIKLEPFRFV